MLALGLREASAKVRTGPPVDEPEDYELPAWAGVLPLRLLAGEPAADARVAQGTPLPAALAGWGRAKGAPAAP